MMKGQIMKKWIICKTYLIGKFTYGAGLVVAESELKKNNFFLQLTFTGLTDAVIFYPFSVSTYWCNSILHELALGT